MKKMSFSTSVGKRVDQQMPRISSFKDIAGQTLPKIVITCLADTQLLAKVTTNISCEIIVEYTPNGASLSPCEEFAPGIYTKSTL